jgi:phospholipid/cholesterol/gamma-HCH transport system substrate-binding protein
MNNKVNYTFIGFLVLFGVSLMLGFTYWLLKPSAEDETQKYYIYFDESVLGLNIDAPVKYRGINVGKVARLRINPENSEQVEVLVTILGSTPIKSGTVAKLTAQGITGLSYINLTLGANDAPPLQAENGKRYPVIKTVPSFFENFEKSLGSVSNQLSSTLTKTETLLSDENQKQIALLLERSAGFMAKMEMLLDDETISHFHSAVKNLDQSSKQLNAMAPHIDALVENSLVWEKNVALSFDSIMHSYLDIKGSANEIKRAVESGEFNVKEIGSDVVPSMNNTLLQFQQFMAKLESFIDKYERSPGDILFKQEAVTKGPGEK